MIIKRNTPHLFVRLNNYENYDFIKEHKNVIKDNGYTWVLKIGKTINRDFINKMIEEKSAIIVKTPNKIGNKFYYCQLIPGDVHNEKLVYPKYYDEYLYFEGFSLDTVKENGYWFKIKNMIEIPEEVVKKFVIIKSKKSMYECATKTRVVHMYIENTEEINI